MIKPYPKYKPSGVDWIGDIPEHREIKKLKYLAMLLNGYAFKPETYVEEGIPIIRIGDVNPIINLTNTKKVAQELLPLFQNFHIKNGDLLIALTGATIGKSTVFNSNQSALLNQRVGLLRAIELLNKHYLSYLISSNIFRTFVSFECDGGAQENIGREELGRFLSVLPPLPEQQSIANFLDKKTSLIDQAVSKKQQLIELLKEERTALINHAVTKGINPDVKLKPSGIEWLGVIPEHWEVKKLKYVAIIKYGLGQPPKQKIGGLPLIRATNVERGRIVEKDLLFVDPEDIPFDRDPILRENDIIVVRSGAYTADSAIIPKKYDSAITGYDMVVRPVDKNPKFIGCGLLSNYILDLQLLPLTLRAAQPHLNREELGETIFVIPPINGQNKVVGYIEAKSEKINNTIFKTEQEITLLQEYRTSLINEAVTGKICVVD